MQPGNDYEFPNAKWVKEIKLKWVLKKN
jgi:hypothetical protein